jgi:UDP-N-acetylglucosamine--N-acetylmuramyl-(pentapeptide) pyrophosphoryl-undecaprenol N-acetylglucosamine transferase
MNRIVFTGGGTGGHIYPGLAVVDELKKITDADIVWIGSSAGIDRSIVENHGLPFFGIPSGKLRRYFSLRNFIDIFKIVAGFFSAFALLLKLRPSVVFSKGGFVSVPPCLAARVLGIPVITHECDFSPGLATKINSRFATRILVSYEKTADFFSGKIRSRVSVTGNPVRGAFYAASAERGRAFLGCGNDVPVVMVQGGSLGARQVNDLIAGCLGELCARCVVVHQTGEQNVDQVIRPGDSAVAGRYKPYPFIRAEMPDVVAAADIVIARSGANTVWECAAAGKPMVLVPLEKGSSRGDQVENARFFVSRGAAVMLTGPDATPEKLVAAVFSILDSERLKRDMAANALALGSSRPAEAIAAIVDACARAKKGERK